MTRLIVMTEAVTALALLVGCAASETATLVNVEGSGSEHFRLDKPSVFARAGGAEITGVVCRRDQTTLLTPQHVRIEQVDASGGVSRVARAYVPTISVKPDQPCSRYSTRINWSVADATRIRICIDRGVSCRSNR